MVAVRSALGLLALAQAMFDNGQLVGAVPVTFRAIPGKRAIDPALILDFGHERGINPTGTGDCDGAIPGGPKIPCSCPPDRDEFAQQLEDNVEAGFAIRNPTVKISFPTGSDLQSQITRITAHLITLQNLKGPGVGCPSVSTTLLERQRALQDQLDAERRNPGGQPSVPAPVSPPPSSPTPTVVKTCPKPTPKVPRPPSAPKPTTRPPVVPTDVVAPKPTSGPPSLASTTIVASTTRSSTATLGPPTPLSRVAQLAPDLGFTKGKNPTGTGDCDSAKPDGLPKIPCQCPPDREEFIRQLEANVKAGKAVNNPEVPIFYPLDDSNNSKRARITASVITLQNLEGPGKGCPLVSTTLAEQSEAIPA